MISPWFVFIECNSTGTGELFATVAREQGYQPVVLTDDPARYTFLDRFQIDFIRMNTSNSLEIRGAAIELAKKAPIAGVYSSSEYFIEAAAELSNSLGLPGANSEAIRHCRNKLQQRLKLREAGLFVPRFHFARSIEDALDGVKRIGLPCILKPILGTGSIGVRLCMTIAEAEQHASLLLQRRVNERGIPVAPEILVEEYVCGPEYSVETFHRKVVGITRKYTTSEPYFVEIGHDFPTTLPVAIVGSFGDAVCRALDAMGLRWGPAHTELRWSNGRITIIEINARLAGGFIPKLVQLAKGVDLISATLSAAVGADLDIEPSNNEYASIRFLVPEEEGILARIDGLEEVLRMPCVADARLYSKPGHVCRIQHDFRDRLGHVIAVGGDQDEVARAAEIALQNMHIRLNHGLADS